LQPFEKVTTPQKSNIAEYIAMASTVAEVVWLVGLFQELGVKISLPVS